MVVSAPLSHDCRMYESRFPEVDDVVMVQVKSIAEMGAYVTLLEYNNIEGKNTTLYRNQDSNHYRELYRSCVLLLLSQPIFAS